MIILLPLISLFGFLVFPHAQSVKLSGVQDENRPCFKIETPLATYYYDSAGAGFTSIVDKDGNDWINFHAGGGSAGEYRGIPNLGPCCHPGYPLDKENNGSSSKVLSHDSSRVVIESRSDNGKMRTTWEFFTTHATMTVNQADAKYYVLYEGTPGGGEKIQESSDYHVTGDGIRKTLNQAGYWHRDLSPEWIYFGDGKMKRVLFLIHHTDDAIEDQFWPMQGNMTVFGFGRTCKGACSGMQHAPNQFSIGISEDSSFSAVSKTVESILKGEQPSRLQPPAREHAVIRIAAPGPGMEIRIGVKPINGGEIEILNLRGESVKTWTLRRFKENQSHGAILVSWNGTNKNGQAVPPGIYFINFRQPRLGLPQAFVFPGNTR